MSEDELIMVGDLVRVVAWGTLAGRRPFTELPKQTPGRVRYVRQADDIGFLYGVNFPGFGLIDCRKQEIMLDDRR